MDVSVVSAIEGSAALAPESTHQLRSKVLRIGGATSISAPEYFFLGKNCAGHFLGSPLQP